jgi:metal-responsive CopG/Arc/MetJ family transcriptional regulator
MKRPRRVRAASSKGMRKTLVALPAGLRRKLDVIRQREGLVLGECIRQALEQWLEQRRGAGK